MCIRDSDERGLVVCARIVPPTSQNQATIEDDLRDLAPRIVDLPIAEATHACEVAIRNYDPCISCATHFVRLTVEHLDSPATPVVEIATTRVLCVGSDHGADRLGLMVAERLAARTTARRGSVEVVPVMAPAMDLAEQLRGVKRVVVVDTVRGEPTGRIVTCPLRSLEVGVHAVAPFSSHGLGVVDAVRLAGALERIPAEAWFVGVHVGVGDVDDTALVGWAEAVVSAVEALLGLRTGAE